MIRTVEEDIMLKKYAKKFNFFYLYKCLVMNCLLLCFLYNKPDFKIIKFCF
jgi:hypothetical protein